jgi:hypothetical protein
MLPEKKENQLFSRPFLIGSVIVFIFLSLVAYLFIVFVSSFYAPSSSQKAQVTIIAFNTQIPTKVEPNSPTPGASTQLPPNQKYSKGLRVKVYGTGGEGLRIHQAAGQDSPTIYLANDGDLFVITAGPVVTGGFIWWEIQSNSSNSVKGWVAEDYIQIELSSS